MQYKSVKDCRIIFGENEYKQSSFEDDIKSSCQKRPLRLCKSSDQQR